jgi:hypothetical protein
MDPAAWIRENVFVYIHIVVMSIMQQNRLDYEILLEEAALIQPRSVYGSPPHIHHRYKQRTTIVCWRIYQFGGLGTLYVREN